MNPIVSIILPTYNGAKYIKRAIDSVLSQSFSDWELLIIDDGSTDNTEEIIKEYTKKDYRIIYLKNEKNLGIQKTLNRGLRLAKGEYIARIDDDDIWIDKDKLKKQVDFLDKNPEYVLVATRVIYKDENGIEIKKSPSTETNKEIQEVIFSRCCFTHSAVVFRKNIILSLGGYSEDEKVKHSEDYDLWLRVCSSEYKTYILPGFSIVYTIRINNVTSTNRITQIKNDIMFYRLYKDKYNGHKNSLLKNYIRLFVYKFILKKPIRLIISDFKIKLKNAKSKHNSPNI
jgi:glycosyltransferase involved in cell wall biosynthesis